MNIRRIAFFSTTVIATIFGLIFAMSGTAAGKQCEKCYVVTTCSTTTTTAPTTTTVTPTTVTPTTVVTTPSTTIVVPTVNVFEKADNQNVTVNNVVPESPREVTVVEREVVQHDVVVQPEVVRVPVQVIRATPTFTG